MKIKVFDCAPRSAEEVVCDSPKFPRTESQYLGGYHCGPSCDDECAKTHYTECDDTAPGLDEALQKITDDYQHNLKRLRETYNLETACAKLKPSPKDGEQVDLQASLRYCLTPQPGGRRQPIVDAKDYPNDFSQKLDELMVERFGQNPDSAGFTTGSQIIPGYISPEFKEKLRILGVELPKKKSNIWNKFNIKLEFKLEDFWIGAFWSNKNESENVKRFDLWICLIPCFPIHIWKRSYENVSPNNKIVNSGDLPRFD